MRADDSDASQDDFNHRSGQIDSHPGTPARHEDVRDVGVMLWESALINLYPFSFLEMDGYNILADLLAMPMLRQQAMALMSNLPRRLRSVRTIDRAEWIQLAYLIFCLVSVLIYLTAHLDAISALLPFSR